MKFDVSTFNQTLEFYVQSTVSLLNCFSYCSQATILGCYCWVRALDFLHRCRLASVSALEIASIYMEAIHMNITCLRSPWIQIMKLSFIIWILTITKPHNEACTTTYRLLLASAAAVFRVWRLYIIVTPLRVLGCSVEAVESPTKMKISEPYSWKWLMN